MRWLTTLKSSRAEGCPGAGKPWGTVRARRPWPRPGCQGCPALHGWCPSRSRTVGARRACGRMRSRSVGVDARTGTGTVAAWYRGGGAAGDLRRLGFARRLKYGPVLALSEVRRGRSLVAAHAKAWLQPQKTCLGNVPATAGPSHGCLSSTRSRLGPFPSGEGAGVAICLRAILTVENMPEWSEAFGCGRRYRWLFGPWGGNRRQVLWPKASGPWDTVA